LNQTPTRRSTHIILVRQADLRVCSQLSFDHNDPSTHNGWFCFSMRNVAPNTDYSLCIMNLTDNVFIRDHIGSPQFKMVGYSSRLQQVMTRGA